MEEIIYLTLHILYVDKQYLKNQINLDNLMLLQQNARLSIRGKLYWKKNDGNWKEHFLVLRTGDLIVSLKEVSNFDSPLSLRTHFLFIICSFFRQVHKEDFSRKSLFKGLKDTCTRGKCQCFNFVT